DITQKDIKEILGDITQKDIKEILGDITQRDIKEILGDITQNDIKEILGDTTQRDIKEILGDTTQIDIEEVLGDTTQIDIEEVLGDTTQIDIEEKDPLVASPILDMKTPCDAGCILIPKEGFHGWAYAFHQDKASLVRVLVANVTLSSSAHLQRENSDSSHFALEFSGTSGSFWIVGIYQVAACASKRRGYGMIHNDEDGDNDANDGDDDEREIS
ncbi:hypothetical protein Tco_0250248, partial [Tanacetum coccineum]